MLQVLRKHDDQHRVIYPAKLFTIIEGERKMWTEEEVLAVLAWAELKRGDIS